MKYKIENDGIDHINVYSKGKTQLGRFLSNFSYSPIETSEGTFSSIEAYWYWLGANDPRRDKIRTLFGGDAKVFGRTLNQGPRLSSEEFQLKIQSAILQKIKNNPEMKLQIENCGLEFVHYYVFKGKTKEATKHRWLMNFFNNLKKERAS